VDRLNSAVDHAEGDIDIFLTCEWPADVTAGVLAAGADAAGSDAVAKLAVAARPRCVERLA